MPGSIQKFFWVASASLLAGIAMAVAGDLQLLQDATSLMQFCFVVIAQAAYYSIVFALVWLVTRRAKNWARWLYVALALYTLRENIWPLGASEMTPLGILILAQGVFKIVAIGLLFTTASGEWLNQKAPKMEA